MKKSAPSKVNPELSDLPIARLDGQDPAQVLPIREYLERNGCAVVLNRKPSLPETYHIICGDEDFVKENLQHEGVGSVYPFVVVFVPNTKYFSDDGSSANAKIAVVSSPSLSAREVTQLFAYFFTGQENMFELKNEHEFYRDSPMKNLNVIHAHVEEPLPPQRKQRNKRSVRVFARYTLLFFCLIFAPVFWYIVSLLIIAGVGWYGYREITSGRTGNVLTVTNITSYWVGQARGSLGVLSLPLGTLGFGSIVRSHERLLSIVTDVIESELAGTTLINESRHLAPLIMTGNEPATSAVSPLVAIDRTRLALGELTNRLGLADAEIQALSRDGGFPFALPIGQRLMKRLQEELNRSFVRARTMQQLVTLFRSTAGFDRKKTYLLTLQNNMELRPTGGFIGSVALATVEGGILDDFAVQDVYALDGQLKGHVDPPGPIKDLLNQEHWYLRDSNWDPDFRVSGEKAAWFYEKETGNNVDGVIGVSVPFLTKLLDITGPLDLPDYNDRITKDNFFGKSLYYTKADFFPGSTQKKDFLSSLTVAIIAKLSSVTKTDVVGFSRAIGMALEDGDIQFWFSDSQSQALAEQAGWAGRIDMKLACEPSCTVERVRLVEANMSVNKVNAYVERSMKVRTDISEEGEMDSTVEVLYTNSSTNDGALTGGGVYRTYLRAYLPVDALVLSVAMDGNEISGKPTHSKGPLVLPYRDTDIVEGNAMTIAVAFDVPPGSSRKITFFYRRGKPFIFDGNRGKFIVLVRKQPGVIQTTLDVGIGYPARWQAMVDKESGKQNTMSGFLANARELRYNTILNRTETFSVQFVKIQ